MEEALVKGKVALMADEEATEVAQVSEGAFDLPAFGIAAERASILRGRARTDQLDSACRQSLAKALRVVGTLTDEPGGTSAGTTRASARHLHGPQGFFREGDLRAPRRNRTVALPSAPRVRLVVLPSTSAPSRDSIRIGLPPRSVPY